MPQSRQAIVYIGIGGAAMATGLFFLSAVLKNPVIALPEAIVSGFAVLGLTRGDRWAGYGFALYLTCSTAGAVFAASHLGRPQSPFSYAGAILPLVIAAFSFLAGKALPPQPAAARWKMSLWTAVSAVPVALSMFFNLLVIPTAAMEPTLLIGDSVMVRRASPSSLSRGDLLVYRDPDKEAIFVKRIVGVGGDRIHLDHKTLYLNGRALNEPYVIHKTTYMDQYRDNFPRGDLNVPLAISVQEQLRTQVRDGDFVVPDGTFFVLGDSRDSSLDSRYSGVIPPSSVIGKAWVICFSTDPPSQSLSRPMPFNAFGRARWDRIFKRPV